MSCSQEPWNPEMVFRARRDPQRQEPPLLEKYAEAHVVRFLSNAFCQAYPAYNYGPMVKTAVNIVKKFVSSPSIPLSTYFNIPHHMNHR
jgi:hypothetical protein